MVDIVKSFTKLYGRAPTMKEVDQMIALKNDAVRYEEYKNLQKYGPPEPPPKKPRARKEGLPTRTPAKVNIINRMLHCAVAIADISYILNLPERNVRNYIHDYRLPRKE